ncbi:hypothetical protein [Gimesia algae]|uniref:Uncharacterized protein n=1 Tax=Gimesia algae TaxID=2527971 RepID=A0A517VIY7_9PLAN|nr:hypothetical protein [Gimesia algae]QDT92974.1 hypothetical protein Pan161_46460 [Gimesia algae]
MLKPCFTVVFCCACASLFADDGQQSVYEMDSFETPVLTSVIEPLVPSENVSYLVDETALKLDQTEIREPAQIFLTQSLPFTPVVRPSAKSDPNLLWPRPRLELQWLMTGKR